jgi:hypothetical protein
MAKYDGQLNSPGVPGNGAALVGGIRLRDLFPSAPSDIPQQAPGQKPRYLKPGEKPPLKDLFPRQPGSFVDPFNPGIPAGGVSFTAPGNGAALAQRVYGQIERGQYNRPGPLGAGIVQPEVFMAPYPGTQPGQPTEFFPLGNPAAGYRFEAAVPGMIPSITTSMNPGINSGMTPMGNAGFYEGPQLGQSVLKGYANKIVS